MVTIALALAAVPVGEELTEQEPDAPILGIALDDDELAVTVKLVL